VEDSQPVDNCGVTNNENTAHEIEERFQEYVFDNSLDAIQAQNVCLHLVQDGTARDLTDAMRMFVDHSMSV